MATRSTRFTFALVLSLASLGALAACGDDGGGTAIDAPIDSAGPGDGGGGDAPAAPSCTDYCTTIATNCTGANLMYANTAECTATCGKFTPGSVGQMSGNTAGCRLYHANNAAGSTTNANTHCRHAGPGGDGQCGSNCEGFCTIVIASCTGGNVQYGGNMGTCMTACANYNTVPIYAASVTTGNTFACRLYHATAAANDPGAHCGHTAMVSSQCQ